jgi:hypothetical protein
VWRRHAKLFVLVLVVVLVLESMCSKRRLEVSASELGSMVIRNAGNFEDEDEYDLPAYALTLDGARQQSTDEKPAQKDIDQGRRKRGRNGSCHHDVPVHGIRSLEIV